MSFPTQVLQSADFASLQRDLDVVELWSGVESIVTAARKKGLQAEPFDKNRVPGVTTFSEDICSGRLCGSGHNNWMGVVFSECNDKRLMSCVTLQIVLAKY